MVLSMVVLGVVNLTTDNLPVDLTIKLNVLRVIHTDIKADSVIIIANRIMAKKSVPIDPALVVKRIKFRLCISMLSLCFVIKMKLYDL